MWISWILIFDSCLNSIFFYFLNFKLYNFTEFIRNFKNGKLPNIEKSKIYKTKKFLNIADFRQNLEILEFKKLKIQKSIIQYSKI